MLIVIWNAILLHARLAGIAKVRVPCPHSLFLQCGYRMVLVWYKYARRWIAFLWIYGQSLRAPDGFLRLTVSDHWPAYSPAFLFV